MDNGWIDNLPLKSLLNANLCIFVAKQSRESLWHTENMLACSPPMSQLRAVLHAIVSLDNLIDFGSLLEEQEERLLNVLDRLE